MLLEQECYDMIRILVPSVIALFVIIVMNEIIKIIKKNNKNSNS